MPYRPNLGLLVTFSMHTQHLIVAIGTTNYNTLNTNVLNKKMFPLNRKTFFVKL